LTLIPAVKKNLHRFGIGQLPVSKMVKNKTQHWEVIILDKSIIPPSVMEISHTDILFLNTKLDHPNFLE
jgi:hypothetical protein